MKHVLSVDQFSERDIDTIITCARGLRKMRHRELTGALTGKVLACVFYEPSTRTSASFIAAMTKLGGQVIPITQGVQFSSVAKGETLEDTVTTLGQYADAIVLRHPETGAVARAAEVSPVPVINAGDGTGEHPTQALLDLFTIHEEVDRPLADLTVALVGDLQNGRTIHSLAKLLARYKTRMLLVAPPALAMPESLVSRLVDAGSEVQEVSLEEAVEASDVVYMTRVQKERLANPADATAPFILTPELVERMRPESRILHPLPRLAEIPTSIDADPRAAYFRQVKNGLFVRMALLTLVLQ